MTETYETIKDKYVSASTRIESLYDSMVQKPGEWNFKPGEILGLIIEARLPFIKNFERLSPEERGKLTVLDTLVEKNYHSCLEFSWSDEIRRETRLKEEESEL